MTHGGLTEDSGSYHPVTPDRKGREGKGIGGEGKSRAEGPIHRLGSFQLGSPRKTDGRSAPFAGGVR